MKYRCAILATTLLASQIVSAQQPQPAPETEEIITLSPFSVVEERDFEYQSTNAQSATRLNVPLEDVPINLQVVNRQFIEDTMSYGGAALGFGGGANREAVSWMGSVEGKAVRGFNTREFLRNGFLRYSDNGSATIERIEVIKGPTSILDGVTSPGGVINVITKKPNPLRDFTRLKAVYGAPLNRIVANFDWNKRLVNRSDGKPLVTFRIAGGYEQSDYYSRYRQRELRNIMPSVLVEFNDKTLIGIQHEYYYVNGERGNDIDGFRRTVRVDDPSGLHGDVPLAELYGVHKYMSWDGPDFSTPEKVNDTLVSIQHRFTSDFVFNLDYNYHHRKVNWGPTTREARFELVDGVPSWRRAWQNNERTQIVEGIRANMAYKVDIGATRHNFVAGFLRQEDNTPSARDVFLNADGDVLYEYFPLDDRDPDLSVPTAASFRQDELNERTIVTDSLYLNHHAKWFNDRLITLWGIYHANFDQESLQFSRPDLAPTRDPITWNTSKTMPQVGVVFSLSDEVGIYANYSQSMQPNIGQLDGFENPFGPTQGEILEVGSKFNILDGKLNGTVSVFQIVESNRILFDPDAPNQENPTGDPNLPLGANVAVGEVTSEGFDADLYFYPIKNFNTVLSYGYHDIEITDDVNPENIGRQQNGFKHKVGLYNRYTWSEGALTGFSANMGVIWRSKRQRNANRFGAPAYAKAMWNLQAGIGYRFEVNEVTYRLNLAVKNLFRMNERDGGYIPGTRDPYYTPYAQETMFSFDVEF